MIRHNWCWNIVEGYMRSYISSIVDITDKTQLFRFGAGCKTSPFRLELVQHCFPIWLVDHPLKCFSRNLQSLHYCEVICLFYHPVSCYFILSVWFLSKDMVAISMQWKRFIRIHPDTLGHWWVLSFWQHVIFSKCTELSDVQTFSIDWRTSQQILSCYAHNFMQPYRGCARTSR